MEKRANWLELIMKLIGWVEGQRLLLAALHRLARRLRRVQSTKKDSR